MLTDESARKKANEQRKTPKDRTKMQMPPDANIPREWVRYQDYDHTVVVMPSRSIKGKMYEVTIDNQTREIRCNCDGFKFHHDCAHRKGLDWISWKRHRARKTGVQKTSIEAYYSIQEDIGEMQRIVLVTIEMYGPISNSRIADKLRRKINTITGRVWELRNMGLVEQAGETLDEITQRMVLTWKVAS